MRWLHQVPANPLFGGSVKAADRLKEGILRLIERCCSLVSRGLTGAAGAALTLSSWRVTLVWNASDAGFEMDEAISSSSPPRTDVHEQTSLSHPVIAQQNRQCFACSTDESSLLSRCIIENIYSHRSKRKVFSVRGDVCLADGSFARLPPGTALCSIQASATCWKDRISLYLSVIRYCYIVWPGEGLDCF